MSKAFDKKLKKMNENFSHQNPVQTEKRQDETNIIDDIYNLNKGREDKIITVSIMDITPNPNNIRKDESWKTDQDMDSLIESIENLGLQQNLVIRKSKPEDKCSTPYVLLSGHRRLEALKRLHEKYPEKKEYEYPNSLELSFKNAGLLSEETAEQLAIVSTNVEIRSLTNKEFAEAIQIYEKAYDEIKQKVSDIKKDSFDPVTKEPTRQLTNEEKELMDSVNGVIRSRDFVAKALNTSARSISNVKRINRNLIDPFLSAYEKNLMKGDAALTLAGESIEIQTAFKTFWNKDVSKITKADVECFVKEFLTKKVEKHNKETKPNIREKDDSCQNIDPKTDLQFRYKKIEKGSFELSGKDFEKYSRYLDKIDDEIRKIEKLLKGAKKL